MTAKTLAERSASYRQRKAERVARYEAALQAILKLETRDVHVGYDSGAGGGNYVYEDFVSAAEAFAIVRNALR